MRATQLTSAFHFQSDREPTWVAHAEFTLRPRCARTGVVGHDKFNFCNHFAFKKYIPPGVLIGTVTPVAVRWPLFLSTLNSVTLPPFSLAAKNQLPVGSKRMLRGVRPPDGTFSRPLSIPVLGSMAKIATLSWPRLPI